MYPPGLRVLYRWGSKQQVDLAVSAMQRPAVPNHMGNPSGPWGASDLKQSIDSFYKAVEPSCHV